MSSNTNSNNNSSSTSALSIASDWTTVPNAQLNWDNNDTEETTATKFQEKCQCKKVQEEEEHCKAEEAEQRHKAEEARACAATEEKQKSTGVKKRSVCIGCAKLKEKCEKKRARKSTMADDEVVVEGWKMGQLEAGGNDAVAEAIHELTRELTGQLDMLTSGTGQPEARGNDAVAEAIHELTRELTSRLDMLTSGILEELQGQLNALENLIKSQQNLSWKMSWHYTILEDMLGELEVFATNPGEPLEEEDMVEEEDLEEARGELEGLGPIVNIEEEMEREQQGENQDTGKGKERAE
ncbi:hypothetical protein ID866_10827 [Astraeus odoratus]|nr:hypothetical protein ID866_10827 [Astraeus odoratus]